jgi:3-hydroxyisobutyrate dehydrogenase-like beta-hydroxyacid dehydrogenase
MPPDPGATHARIFRMNLGFIGLGNMGAGMAANLVRAGHQVRVWNRSRAKAGPLVELGATLADDPRTLAADADVVFTMLGDDAALRSVLEGPDGAYAGLARGAIHVSMSTIGVATAEELTAKHAERGQGFVSAPVFGRPEAAAAAKLFVVCAGPAADMERIAPLLAKLGQRVLPLGERPASANLVKLCGNFMILSAIESLAEAMTLAERGGVGKRALLEVLTNTLFDVPVIRNYGAMLIDERFRPAGFAAPWGLKDMRLVAESAAALDLSMPFLRVLDANLVATIANEGADIDWSGIAKTIADGKAAR